MFSPAFLPKVRPGSSMAIGSLGYTAFFVSAVVLDGDLLVPGGVFCGLGAGVLWPGSGSFVFLF